MTWTVSKLIALIAMLIGTGLTWHIGDGNIWIGTMAAVGAILGAKNLSQNGKTR